MTYPKDWGVQDPSLPDKARKAIEAGIDQFGGEACPEVIIDIYLERSAVVPEIAERAAALAAIFGAEDDASLDVVFGKHVPNAKLPFELQASMEAVRQQKKDLPYDSKDPLFRFGYGLTY
jgi:beta-glucosidase